VTRVVVLGGGIAGFSAAHELAERGFEVVIVERSGIPGGKARSSPVLPTGPLPWRAAPRYRRSAPDERVPWIPGEHGFRFFPGFYRHVVDSMTRIPAADGLTAADHLVPIARCGITQYDKPTFTFPIRTRWSDSRSIWRATRRASSRGRRSTWTAATAPPPGGSVSPMARGGPDRGARLRRR